MHAFVFDTETSGLIDNHTMPLDKQPEIIEFYGATLDLDTGEVLDEIDTLIKPRREITDEITKITGIENDDLKDALPFSAHAPRIRRAIGTADAAIAHNLSFDKEMLEIECERLGGIELKWPARMICTVEQTIHLKGYRLSLQALHELLFGEPFKEAHRAKTDVQALVKCTVELFRRGEI